VYCIITFYTQYHQYLFGGVSGSFTFYPKKAIMKSALLCLIATVASLSPLPSHGFHTPSCSTRHARSSTKLHASPKPASTDDGNPSPAAVFLKSTIAAATTFALASTNAVWAVSGGGVDYASMDITGQDFSNNNFKGKDFTQVCSYSILGTLLNCELLFQSRCDCSMQFVVCWLLYTAL
jgi:hypothetical protein